MQNIFEILEEFSRSVHGFFSTSVVSRFEGTAIASVNLRPDLSTEPADAYFTSVLEQMSVIEAVLGEKESSEDLVATSHDIGLILRSIPGTDYFWWVTTDASTNPAFTRAIMKKYLGAIASTLPT